MRRIWQWFATALLVAIFLSLANWQWNRADELKNPTPIDQTVVPIDSLIAPNESITDEAVGRRVEVEGRFVSSWIAPNQSTGKDGNRTFDVGLFKTKDNAMILIVRGYHQPAISKILNLSEVKVIGYLLPQQSEDVAESTINNPISKSGNQIGNQIGRIDSSLFVTQTDLPLYAPYIQAITEEPPSGYEVVPFEMGKKVPGYYWQHISYVVIWVLFAITAIFLMFYQRRLDKHSDNPSDKVQP